jgi:hypothetical protein
VSLAELVDYWFGGLDAEAEAALEEHLFECASCAGELDAVVRTGQALVAAMRSGSFAARGTTALGNRLARDRRNLRQYVLYPGEVVPCTVSTDYELLLAHLVLPEPAPSRLDLSLRDERGGELMRVDDVTVDRRTGRVSMLVPARPVQAYPSGRLHYVLIAPAQTPGSAGIERVVGAYTLEHTAMNES